MSNTKLALSFRIFKAGQLIREDQLDQAVIKIGKVPSAHLRIDDDSVSRMHAVIEVTGLEVSLIDLGSTRGTFVNGKKINKATLRSGDVLTLGDVRVELAIGDAAPARRPTLAIAAARPPVIPNAARSRPVVPALPRPAIGEAESRGVGSPTALPAGRGSSPVGSIGEAEWRGVGSPTALPAGRGSSPVGSIAALSAVPPVPVPALAAPVAPARPVALPIEAVEVTEVARSPVGVQRPIAAPDELGGAGAVEVAAMLGDSVIGVKHCMDPRSGKVTPATWAILAGGAACLLASAIAFATALATDADNTARLHAWTGQHKPAYAFRPSRLGPGVDGMAFGGLGLGLVGLTLGLVRRRHERTSPYYRIGTAPGVELALEHAPLPAFPLVAPSGDDFVFNYGGGIDGELIVDGKATPFAELAAAGRARPSAVTAGAIEVPIPPKARIRARAGQTTFVVSAVARPRRHATPLFVGFERRTLAYVAGSLALHFGIWAFLQTLPPDAEGANVDLPTSEDSGISARNIAQAEPLPDKIEDQGDTGGQKADAAKMALPSGKAGNPDAAKSDGHLQVAQNQDQPHLSREEAIRIAISEGILGSDRLVSGVRSMSATADFASGFDTTNINGPIYGADGSGLGNFGGGFIGSDLGGGCREPPCGTIGTGGRYNTINTGSHAGGNYGFPMHDGPGGRGHQPAVPRIGEPVTQGADYSKSIIRRYIRRHINEIGYCYEKQLLAHPDLGGALQVKFFISPTGAVQSASGTGFDREVSSCVASVIQTIEFPSPGGGGGVEVNYPFNFHPLGR